MKDMFRGLLLEVIFNRASLKDHSSKEVLWERSLNQLFLIIAALYVAHKPQHLGCHATWFEMSTSQLSINDFFDVSLVNLCIIFPLISASKSFRHLHLFWMLWLNIMGSGFFSCANCSGCKFWQQELASNYPSTLKGVLFKISFLLQQAKLRKSTWSFSILQHGFL